MTKPATKAAEGAWVTWPGGRGKVTSVHTEGLVPAVAAPTSATEAAPAARLAVYEETANGWAPTGERVARDVASLTVVDEPQVAESVDGEWTFGDIRSRIEAAIEASLRDGITAAGGSPGYICVYVRDFTTEWAVYAGPNECMYRVTYTLDATGNVTLGTPEEVAKKTVYQPVADAPPAAPTTVETTGLTVVENDRVIGRVLEAKGTDAETGGRIFRVRIIAVGESRNGRRYPENVLRAAAPLYEGAKAYDHHRTAAEMATGTTVGLVGYYRKVEANTEGVDADFHVLPSAAHTAEALDASLANQAENLPVLVGLSHDVSGRFRTITENGQAVQEAVEITTVYSADIVSDPAAGGLAQRVVAGGIEPVTTTEGNTMPEPAAAPVTETAHERASVMGGIVIKTAISNAGLPDQAVEAITSLLPERFTETQLTSQIAAAQAMQAGFEKAGLIPTVKAGEGVTSEAHDKKVKALDATFAGNYREGFRSIQAAYSAFTGKRPDYLGTEDFARQILRESFGPGFDSGRTSESMTTASWDVVLGDSITRRMIALYGQPQLQSWRSIVSDVVPVNDFRQQKRERIGGFGTLPTVNQGAPYQDLGNLTDEEATYTVAKRGGTVDLTWEMIVNDDLGQITRIPRLLGLAAAQTLYRFVWDILPTNAATTYDTVALFDAAHANTTAVALSQSGLSQLRQKMRDQSAYGDATNILSIVPKYLVVPNELEELAFQLCTSAVAIPGTPAGPTDTPNIHQGMTPIVVDHLTDANDWYTVADPSLVPTIEVGFLHGQEDPELFTQADQTSGSVFTADKYTYKIRHTYSATPLDHRGFQRGTQ